MPARNEPVTTNMKPMTDKRLRKCLDHLGLTQRGAARFLGYNDRTVRGWIAGRRLKKEGDEKAKFYEVEIPRIVTMLLETMVAYDISVADVLATVRDKRKPDSFGDKRFNATE